MRKYEAEFVCQKEVALRARGASNAGYHYLGCAKTFALIGKAFAEAILEMRDQQNKINEKESPTP